MLTLLAPSERADIKRDRRHKLLTDWAGQGMLQLCRCMPGRRIVSVDDASFAVHALAHAIARFPAGRATLTAPVAIEYPSGESRGYGHQ